MSVGILPGMASYSGNTPPVAADQMGNANLSAGFAAPGLGNTNLGGGLSLKFGSDNTVVQTVLVFAVLYFAVVGGWHLVERYG